MNDDFDDIFSPPPQPKKQVTLPPDPSNETAVLGAVLVEPDRVLPMLRRIGLTHSNFSSTQNKQIYRAILDLADSARPVSPLTVMESTGLDFMILSKIMESCTSWTHAEHHAGQIIEASRKRRLLEIGQDILRQAGNGSTSSEIVESIKEAIKTGLDHPGGLPTILDASKFTTENLPEPTQVIHGVLHAGSKAVYGGPSKAFKSWSLLDMCLAVSTGGDWLGFKTTPGPVLYINFELQAFALQRRLQAIANFRNCEIHKTLRLWNLRGFSRPLSNLLPDLLRQIEGDGYSLIVPDPIYKTLAGRNENDAGEIAEVCAEIEHMAVKTGAAIAFGAHFAKGNASGKEHLDRVSGSGVWARDPDAIITATSHKQEGAFSVEMTLRNFAPSPPFVIRWEYPAMRRDDSMDPADLKQPKMGRPEENSMDDLMHYLRDGMKISEWEKECRKEGGVSRATFYRLKKQIESLKMIESKDGLIYGIAPP